MILCTNKTHVTENDDIKTNSTNYGIKTHETENHASFRNWFLQPHQLYLPLFNFSLGRKLNFQRGWNNQINIFVTFYRHCISYLFSTLANHHLDAWQTFFASNWSLDFKSFTKSGQILGWIPMNVPSCTNEENAQKIKCKYFNVCQNVPKNVPKINHDKKMKVYFHSLKMKVLYNLLEIIIVSYALKTIKKPLQTVTLMSTTHWIFCFKTQEIFWKSREEELQSWGDICAIWNMKWKDSNSYKDYVNNNKRIVK